MLLTLHSVLRPTCTLYAPGSTDWQPTVPVLSSLCSSLCRGKHIFVAPSKPPSADDDQQQQGGGGQPQQGGGEQHGGQPQGSTQQRQQQQGGRVGRAGGREGGGRDGGRGRGGRDGGRGRAGIGAGAAAGRGGPRHRSMIDLGEDAPAGEGGKPAAAGAMRGFVPRLAALGGKLPAKPPKGGSEGGAAAPANDGAPKSNADFRSMFLKK